MRRLQLGLILEAAQSELKSLERWEGFNHLFKTTVLQRFEFQNIVHETKHEVGPRDDLVDDVFFSCTQVTRQQVLKQKLMLG